MEVICVICRTYSKYLTEVVLLNGIIDVSAFSYERRHFVDIIVSN